MEEIEQNCISNAVVVGNLFQIFHLNIFLKITNVFQETIVTLARTGGKLLNLVRQIGFDYR